MVATCRVLCLGNELLADDAFGLVVAKQLRLEVPSLDVVETSAGGLGLIDHLQNVSLLLVVDCIQTGLNPPGTVYVLHESDIKSVSGGSPHYIGLFETLTLARKLLPSVPEEVIILAVEASDCTTVGGPMHPAVRAALSATTDLVREIVQPSTPPGVATAPGESKVLERAVDAVAARFGRERFVVM